MKGHLFSATYFTISILCSNKCKSHSEGKCDSYLVSIYVSWQCEYVMLGFPICLNAAVMLPFLFKLELARMVCAAARSLVLSTALTVSSPQHIFAWHCNPLVDLASPVSKNQRTSRPCLPLHWSAAHWKMWMQWSLTYLIQGEGAKNT